MKHRSLEAHRAVMAEQRARREGRKPTRVQRFARAMSRTIETFVSAFRITRPEVRPGRTFNSIAAAARYRDLDVWESRNGQMPSEEWIRRGARGDFD